LADLGHDEAGDDEEQVNARSSDPETGSRSVMTTDIAAMPRITWTERSVRIRPPLRERSRVNVN
jgi:hypothetical protein